MDCNNNPLFFYPLIFFIWLSIIFLILSLHIALISDWVWSFVLCCFLLDNHDFKKKISAMSCTWFCKKDFDLIVCEKIKMKGPKLKVRWHVNTLYIYIYIGPLFSLAIEHLFFIFILPYCINWWYNMMICCILFL